MTKPDNSYFEDIFYPWTKKDYNRPVFEEGEKVLVRQRNAGNGYYTIEGKISTVRIQNFQGRKIISYFVEIPQQDSMGDIPLRDLRPLWSEEQLTTIVSEKLERTYDLIKQGPPLQRDAQIRLLSLLDRINKEIKA